MARLSPVSSMNIGRRNTYSRTTLPSRALTAALRRSPKVPSSRLRVVTSPLASSSNDAPHRLPSLKQRSLFQDQAASAAEAKDPCDIEEIFSRCRHFNADEKNLLNAAIQRSHSYLNKTIKGLESGDQKYLDRVRLFFGNEADPAKIAEGLHMIKERITEIKRADHFYIDPDPTRCGVLGFTFMAATPDSPEPEREIYLRGPLFELPPDIQAGVIIHEAAHSALKVIDVPLADGSAAYGPERAVGLAAVHSQAAMSNADNWALFVNSKGFENDIELTKWRLGL